MPKVAVLPQVLAHQIAAGEVVERPASVVKELVENSLDAEATRISVVVEQGGRRSIRVSDNGCGMSAEDAQLAFEHHATSKISSFDDLQTIRSLGFRGEALPSIASISRTCMRTMDTSSPVGTEIRYEGGQLKDVREIGWVKGTEMLVEDLFFNVPARRKFLKTVATELSHITRQVTGYALAYPAVEFRLEHQGRKLISATSVGELRDRVFQLFGETLVENLVPLSYQSEGVQINGFTSLPHEQRNNANSLHLYVNGRMVRDRVLTHAIRLAYQDLIPSSAFPVLILFVEVDPQSVDVNVHPTKNEIRFHDSGSVHRAILRAIEQGLLGHRTSLSSLARDISLPESHTAGQGPRAEHVRRSVESYFQRHPDSSLGFPAFRNWNQQDRTRPGAGTTDVPLPGPGPNAHDGEIPETTYLSPIPIVLGQFVESFIVAADREGIMLIDQHVAHERVLYDLALRRLESSEGASVQKLLLPLTLELSPQQNSLVDELIDQLNANGFEVEWFGQQTLAVKGVPALTGETDPKELMESLLEELQTLDLAKGDRSPGSQRRLRETIAISLSCRSAIKINTPLSPEKMQWLLDELFRCDNPYTCPHGRPVVLRLNIEEILRGFKRI